MSLKSVLMEELTWYEYAERIKTGIILLPVASTEQHGPHLPVCVDTLVAERLAAAVAERAAPDAGIIVCPTVTFGASHHHLIFPGALSL